MFGKAEGVASADAVAPLKPKGSLALNYGENSGTNVLQFQVDETEKVDVGVLKVVVSDVDFRSADIAQPKLETIGASRAMHPVKRRNSEPMKNVYGQVSRVIVQVAPEKGL